MIDDIFEKMRIHAAKEPSEQEMQETSENWFEPHLKLNFKDWNEELVLNTYPFILVPISSADISMILETPFKIENISKKLLDDIHESLIKLKCKFTFHCFRPDLYQHSFIVLKPTIKLSFGFVRYYTKGFAEKWAEKEIEKSKDLLNEQTKNRIIYG